jgi:MFS family permease
MTEKQRFRWTLLTAVFLVNAIVIGFSWMATSPLVSHIVADFALAKGAGEYIFASYAAAIAIFAVPAGMLGDRFGVRISVAIGVVITGVFGILRGTASDFSVLLVYGFLTGTGMAFVVPNLPKAVGVWFPKEEFGIANGLVVAGVNIGNALSVSLVGVMFLPAFGTWRACFYLVGLLALITTIMWWVVARDTPAPPSRSGSGEKLHAHSHKIDKNAVGRILHIRDMWPLLGMQFCILGFFIGFTGALHHFLEVKGMGGMASFATSLALITPVIGNLLFPAMSDRTGRRKPFIIPFALITGLCIYAVSVLNGVPLWIALVGVGISEGAYMPLVYVIPLEMKGVGIENAATATGLIYCFGNIGGILIPVVAGHLIGAYSFETAFMFLALVAACVAVLNAFMKEIK